MGIVGLILIGMAAGVFVLGLIVVRYAQFIVTRMVDRKHMAAELIVQSGAVPPRWYRRFPQWKVASSVAKWRVMLRLRSIIQYFRVTTLIEDEATRTSIVEELVAVRDRWKQLHWHEIRELQSFGQWSGGS